MYLIYSLLVTLGAILIAPYYLLRRWSDMRRTNWRERLGLLPATFQQQEQQAIWVHAVSVGETLAVAGLVGEMQQAFPGRQVFLSHVTPAGRAAGESRLPGVAGRFYLPLDWRWAVKAALRRIRPALLVIVETELWPNLLRAAHDSGAHVILVNARLSARSFGRYGLVKPFMRRVLSDVDRICAQTPADAERFWALGARSDAVVLTGNLKFDFQPPTGGGVGALARLISKELARAQRGPILVAASTMPGEEAVILPAWARIKARHPGALLILAPRHPARFDEVARILTAAHLSFLRRTSLFFGAGNNESRVASVAAATAPATSIAQPRGAVSEETLAGQLSQVLLLDTIGELAGIFELADVVFMGGSLVPTGGHNLLEPAYWSKPIVFGPHMENFKDIARLFLEARAALQVRDAEGLAQATLELLDEEAGRRKLGERARQILEREAGATRRTLGYIRELLGL